MPEEREDNEAAAAAAAALFQSQSFNVIYVIFNLIFSDVLSQLAVKVTLRTISNQNIFITSVHKSGFFLRLQSYSFVTKSIF